MTITPEVRAEVLHELLWALGSGIVPSAHVRGAVSGRPTDSRMFDRFVGVGGYPAGPVLNLEALRQHVAGGGTAIIDDVDRFVSSVRHLASELGPGLHLSSAVAFFTGASTAGLKLHVDRADVIAVQLSGTKTWILSPELYGVGGPSVPIPTSEAATMATDEVHMVPGDILRVPAWQPHATTRSAGVSVHIALQFMPGEFEKTQNRTNGSRALWESTGSIRAWFDESNLAYAVHAAVSTRHVPGAIIFERSSNGERIELKLGDDSTAIFSALKQDSFHLHDLHPRAGRARSILNTLISRELVYGPGSPTSREAER